MDNNTSAALVFPYIPNSYGLVFPFIWYFLWVEHCFGFVEMSVQNGEYFNKKCPHFILLDF